MGPHPPSPSHTQAQAHAHAQPDTAAPAAPSPGALRAWSLMSRRSFRELPAAAAWAGGAGGRASFTRPGRASFSGVGVHVGDGAAPSPSRPSTPGHSPSIRASPLTSRRRLISSRSARSLGPQSSTPPGSQDGGPTEPGLGPEASAPSLQPSAPGDRDMHRQLAGLFQVGSLASSACGQTYFHIVQDLKLAAAAAAPPPTAQPPELGGRGWAGMRTRSLRRSVGGLRAPCSGQPGLLACGVRL
jgi:hypothetical protein